MELAVPDLLHEVAKFLVCGGGFVARDTNNTEISDLSADEFCHRDGAIVVTVLAVAGAAFQSFDLTVQFGRIGGQWIDENRGGVCSGLGTQLRRQQKRGKSEWKCENSHDDWGCQVH